MTIAYAYIDQVWEPVNKKLSKTNKASSSSSVTSQNTSYKTDPACSLYKRRKGGYNKNYDDIIDTYLDDSGAPGEAVDVSPNYQPGIGMLGRSVVPGEDEFLDVPLSKPITQIPTSSKRSCGLPTESNRANDNEDALEYDRFFANDHLFALTTPNAPVQTCNANDIDDEENPNVNVQQEQEYHNQQYIVDEESTHLQPSLLSTPNGTINYPTQMHDYSQRMGSQYSAPAPWVEILLFIASGILLIFLLEQVLQMGIYMR